MILFTSDMITVIFQKATIGCKNCLKFNLQTFEGHDHMHYCISNRENKHENTNMFSPLPPKHGCKKKISTIALNQLKSY